MKINGSPDRIKPDGGDYVLLHENYSEGLTVYRQYATLAEALADLPKACYSPSILVKLVEVDAVER